MRALADAHGGDARPHRRVARASRSGAQRAFRPLLPVTQLALQRSRHDRGGEPRLAALCAAAAAVPRPLSAGHRRAAGDRPRRGALCPGDAADARKRRLPRIRFQDEARNNKPAAIYWLQAASVAALSDAASDGDLALSRAVAARRGGRRAADLRVRRAARRRGRRRCWARRCSPRRSASSPRRISPRPTRCCCSPASRRKARSARFIARRGAAGLPAAGRCCSGRPRALAMLVKGPVGAGARASDRGGAVACRPRRALAAGLAAALGRAAVPRASCCRGSSRSRSRPAAPSWRNRLGHDFLGKLVGAQESHGAWPGYLSCCSLPVTFWPGSLLLGAAAVFAWRERGEPAVRFLIAWAVPFWLVLELVPTKLPHYLLPVFPALALLAGRAALDARASLPRCGAARSRRRVGRGERSASPRRWRSAPLRLGAADRRRGLSSPRSRSSSIGGGARGARLWRAVTPGLAARAAAAGAPRVAGGVALEAPRLDPLWLSRAAAAMVARSRRRPARRSPRSAMTSRASSSCSARSTVLAAPQAGGRRSPRRAARWRSSKAARTMPSARPRASAAWRRDELGRVAGLDYSNGKRMVLTLYRGAPG